MAVFTTLGIFNGLLGALDFGWNAFPDGTPDYYLPYPDRNAFFKVYVGLNHGDMSNAGGDLPDARLFDYHGKFIGMVADPGTYVHSGKSGIFWAGTSGGQNPVYTLFTGNYDAQCIAFVTVTWPGNSGHFGWVGDWGSECAGDDRSIATWYFSKIAVPGTTHFPNCMWVDLDGGAPATAFQVNWVDLTPGRNETRIGQPAHDMCQSPSFHIYQHYDPNSIIYHNREDDKQKPGEAPLYKRSEQAPPRKRTKPRRTPEQAKIAFEDTWRDKVVIDDVPSHTARALCGSDLSAGPSFVNPEDGFFCDMQIKKVHPVCKEEHGNNVCYDLEQRQLVGPGVQKRSAPFEAIDWRLERMNETAQSQGA